MTVRLGEKYRDAITGFKGVATARAEYLHDSPSIKIEANTGPSADKKEQWISETRLEPVPPPSGSGFKA